MKTVTVKAKAVKEKVKGAGLRIKQRVTDEGLQVHPALVVQRHVCPLCGDRAADTRVAIGPVSVEICKPCSDPVWHGLGLFQWAKKFLK